MRNTDPKNISSPDGPASAAVSSLRVLIAAGGTGGHVYPAIAIADALREASARVEILFVGTRNHMEWDVVPRAGYDIVSVWISGFHRRLTLKNVLFPVKLVFSMVQSFSILSKFEPHVAVACGGYASGPIGWMAAKRGIPLVLQEQNSFPGVTTRLLAKHAAKIFTAFNDADRFLPEEKTHVTGNPTRKKLKGVGKEEGCRMFGFDPGKPVLLVLGGSGGAKTINDAMAAHIKELHDSMGLQIIWQCGERYFDELHMRLNTEQYEGLKLADYLHAMPEAYGAADLVVSRAGALSCSELALTGKPSILIPSPNVAGDHQTKNARSMVDEGAAELLEDSEAESRLAEMVKKLIFDESRLAGMKRSAEKLARPEAAAEIAKEVMALAQT